MSAEPNGGDRPKITFSYLIKNVISLMGLFGMVCFGLFLLIRVSLDLAGYFKDAGAYDGLVTYIVLPSFFTGSLIFTGLGMYLKWRRTRQRGFQIMGGSTPTRRYMSLGAAVVVTSGWLLLSAFGTYKAYGYTDSVQFCGQACHQVMYPEYTAYKQSPHARVKCVECHIGPGASWFVKSKITGMYQLWAVATHTYKTPIKTPLHNLRPARETCEACHWPGRFSGKVERVITHYDTDDDNTPTRYNLLMKVGGGSDVERKAMGIHWHVSENQEVQYLALDEQRQDIPYVRVTDKLTGKVQEFVSPGFDRSKVAESGLRTMDCLDCHNRPSHIFKSPGVALDEAMDHNLISPKLPGVKDLTLKLVSSDKYKTQDEAEQAIKEGFDQYIKDHKFTGENLALAQKACDETVFVYKTNFFPEQGVDYRAFVNNLGHYYYKGCERCHDGQHKSVDQKATISNDCNLCHLLIGQASGVEDVAKPPYTVQEFDHPPGPVPATKPCAQCHGLNKKKEAE